MFLRKMLAVLCPALMCLVCCVVFRWLDTLGSARYLDMVQQYQHLGPLYDVPEGLRNKARHNESYYPAVEPARPVGELKTA